MNEAFNMVNKAPSHRCDVEDYLQAKGVFVDGITGEPCHSDSYMTIVLPDKLREAVDDSRFSEQEWVAWAMYEYPSYCPMLRFATACVKRFLKEKLS